jgi:hypothetical protein
VILGIVVGVTAMLALGVALVLLQEWAAIRRTSRDRPATLEGGGSHLSTRRKRTWQA